MREIVPEPVPFNWMALLEAVVKSAVPPEARFTVSPGADEAVSTAAALCEIPSAPAVKATAELVTAPFNASPPFAVRLTVAIVPEPAWRFWATVKSPLDTFSVNVLPLPADEALSVTAGAVSVMVTEPVELADSVPAEVVVTLMPPVPDKSVSRFVERFGAVIEPVPPGPAVIDIDVGAVKVAVATKLPPDTMMIAPVPFVVRAPVLIAPFV